MQRAEAGGDPHDATQFDERHNDHDKVGFNFSQVQILAAFLINSYE